MKRTAPTLVIATIIMFLAVTAAWAEGQRIITDMAGRRVTLHGPVQRIVPTFKPVTLCILSLGLQDRLAGIDTHSKRDPLTRALFPKVTQLTGVGTKSTGINLEALLSLSPDLVILYAQKDGVSLAHRLERMGISAIIILPESMDSIKRSLETIARAVGVPHRAQRVINAMDMVLSQVDAATADMPSAEKKRAYFASSRSFFNTAAGNMLQDTIISRAGMINVSHDLNGYFQDISPEQLLRWNPDLIFISRNLKGPRRLPLDNPAVKKVRAVTRHHIYRFPCNLAPWDFPSPLSALATLWAARQAYPEKFKKMDFMGVVDGFHKDVFGKTLTAMGGRLNDHLPLDGSR